MDNFSNRVTMTHFLKTIGVVLLSTLFLSPTPIQAATTSPSYQAVKKWTQLYQLGNTHFDKIIREAAKYYRLPPALIKAIIAAESSFNPKAISPAGAIGLMQLMPSTAKAMHIHNPFSPRQSIYGGTRYIRTLTNQFNGNLIPTIASYNAGPGAVKKYGGIPPYTETQQYVEKGLKIYRYYLESWDQSLPR